MTMRRFFLVMLLGALCLPAFAQVQRERRAASPRPIPPAVVAQHERVQRLIPAPAKQKLAQLVPGFRAEVMKLPPQADFGKVALADVKRKFPGLSNQQYDVLVFELMHQTVDSLNEQSETQSLELQMTMDRRSKLIDTLSNVLKKISDTGDSVVQNLK
jgi:hypothetical protein